MHLLILGPYAPTLLSFRGALIKAVVAKGHRVSVAAPDIGPDLAAMLRLIGASPHQTALERSGTSLRADLGYFRTLLALFRRLRPDAMLAYTIKPVVWGLIAGSLSGVHQRAALITGLGYAFTGKAQGKRGLVQRIARLLYRFALRRATLIFFQNPDDRDDFARMGLLPAGVPVVVVNGSGVELAHYAPVDLPAGPTRFLLIARLLGDKGIREYVAAAARLGPSWPGVSFHLVGPLDPNPDALGRDEVAAWHAAGTIEWHGALADVRPALAAAHVFVLPSYREGTPRTVLEAMAMGRAIITTDAPGCRQTIRDGVEGLLVPPRNADRLADAMERFLVEPSLIATMAHRAQVRAQEKYDVDQVNRVMLDHLGI